MMCLTAIALSMQRIGSVGEARLHPQPFISHRSAPTYPFSRGRVYVSIASDEMGGEMLSNAVFNPKNINIKPSNVSTFCLGGRRCGLGPTWSPDGSTYEEVVPSHERGTRFHKDTGTNFNVADRAFSHIGGGGLRDFLQPGAVHHE
ncbi:hypothetical protein [Rhizobium laguerreae]|uniref:hypothetical protein n=1 Tax=Rhizobium laguerreae TaxID=1076926 RepID=UPI0030099522